MVVAAVLALIIVQHPLLLALDRLHNWVSLSQRVHLNELLTVCVCIAVPLIACYGRVALISESSRFLSLKTIWTSSLEV